MVAAVAEQKELDDLVSTLGGNKLKMCEPCMEGICSDILQAIETEVKNTGGHNMIWIRGSPGVGKSALAASISTRLQDQNRHVISFRFDRTQSTTITTDSSGTSSPIIFPVCTPPFANTWSNMIKSMAHPISIAFSKISLRHHYPAWVMCRVRSFR